MGISIKNYINFLVNLSGALFNKKERGLRLKSKFEISKIIRPHQGCEKS